MRWLALFAIPLLFDSPLSAQEKDETVEKQKMAALANLKKCEVANPALIETTNLIVGGGYPEEKLKSMGEMVQKSYTSALKALKFSEMESPPKGKLAIYFFADRKQFSAFVNEVLTEKLERDERTHIDARGNEPFVAVSVLPGEKPIDLDAEASRQVGVALLLAKAGPALMPSWMQDGFARALQTRSNPQLAAADKAAVRKLIVVDPKTKASKFQVWDIWGSAQGAERKVLAASFMEYLLFGPDQTKFKKIVEALRPDDTLKPTFETALKAAEIAPDALDKAWKKWVMTGK